MRRSLAETECGAPVRRPTALDTLVLVMDALQVPRDTPWDELPPLVALRCRTLNLVRLRDLIAGGLAQGLAELGGRAPVDPQALAERVAGPLHAVLVAQHQGGGLVGEQRHLEDLADKDLRVLAAICLLGARHSQAGNLVAVTRLSPTRLADTLRRLEAAGVVTRLRQKASGMGDEAWWPTTAWHASLAPVLEFADLVPAVEEQLAFLAHAGRLAS